MSHSLATYLSLPGNTAAAMSHWHDVFGGELEIMTYGEAQLEDMPFTPNPEHVAHSTLTLPGGIIAAGDAVDTDEDYPVRGTAYSLLYTTDTPDEARSFIAKLIEAGGETGMPFEEAPWGDWYGQVFDKFGVMWSFSCAA